MESVITDVIVKSPKINKVRAYMKFCGAPEHLFPLLMKHWCKRQVTYPQDLDSSFLKNDDGTVTQFGNSWNGYAKVHNAEIITKWEFTERESYPRCSVEYHKRLIKPPKDGWVVVTRNHVTRAMRITD